MYIGWSDLPSNKFIFSGTPKNMIYYGPYYIIMCAQVYA